MGKSRNKRKKKNRRGSPAFPGYRQCGDCVECCVTLHISALNKPKHTACPNLCKVKAGCKIYSQRPTECMTFQCMWSQRDLPNSAKPSETGIMAYYVESQFGPTVFVTETRPGSFTTHEKVKEAALNVASKKGMAAIVSTYEGVASAMIP